MIFKNTEKKQVEFEVSLHTRVVIYFYWRYPGAHTIMITLCKRTLRLHNTGGALLLLNTKRLNIKGIFRGHLINRIMGVIISEVGKGLQLKWTV